MSTAIGPVDEDWAGPVAVVAADEACAHQLVQLPRDLAHAFVRKGQGDLGRDEGGVRRQVPLKRHGVDAHRDAQVARLANLGVGKEAARVHQAERVVVADLLGVRPVGDDDERVVLVRRRAAAALDALGANAQAVADEEALA